MQAAHCATASWRPQKTCYHPGSTLHGSFIIANSVQCRQLRNNKSRLLPEIQRLELARTMKQLSLFHLRSRTQRKPCRKFLRSTPVVIQWFSSRTFHLHQAQREASCKSKPTKARRWLWSLSQQTIYLYRRLTFDQGAAPAFSAMATQAFTQKSH